MQPSRRRAVAFAAALACAGLIWLGLRPAAVSVELGAVSRGPLEISVDEEGETRVRQRFVVAAPATGRLLRIPLKEGDAVEVDDVLARVVPVPLDPRDRAAAEARLAVAEDAKRGAAVVTKLKLAEVAVQVRFAAMLIDASHAALENRKDVLDGV